MDARAGAPCAIGSMGNDDEDTFVQLGDVVARIAQRLEVTGGPPVARADADLFLRVMSGDIFAPVRAERLRDTPEQAQGEASDRAGLPHSGAGRS
jgi:hypothetical protein